MYAIGIDIGSLTTKAVVMNDGMKVASVIIDTGDESETSASKALERVLAEAGINGDSQYYVVTTGIGGKGISFSNKQKAITTCLARGMSLLNPDVKAVVDIGAESSTVVKLSNKGKVMDWANHDKCAAGTGLFLKQMARLMKLSIEEMSEMSKDAKKGADISGTCAVFSESEVISHVHRVPPTPMPDIALGIYLSVTGRIKTMCKRIGVTDGIAFSGGVALNEGLMRTLASELGTEVFIPEEPERIAALGAAVLAGEEIQKGRS